MGKGTTTKLSFLNSFKFCQPKNPSSMVIKSHSHINYDDDDDMLYTPLNSKSFDVLFSYNPTPPPSTPSYIGSKPRPSKSCLEKSKSNEAAPIVVNGCKGKGGTTAQRFKRLGSNDAGEVSGIRKGKSSRIEVKRSDDPFTDFKNSMVEMIVDREVSDAKELEELLMSFISLNSRVYHKVIVEAFTEIVREMFVLGGGSKNK